MDTDSREDYDKITVKLLLATAFFCLGSFYEALELTKQVPQTVTNLAKEIISLCGIIYLISPQNKDRILNDGLTIELPYALSECGDPNEKIHVKPQSVVQEFPLFMIRHGYDCYKMRTWRIRGLTILDELKKWISRLPVLRMNFEEQENT